MSLVDGDLATAPEEFTCRICRCEGTDEDPLFYPCKCRGSIKYIHQGCLEEWLKRSGRGASCDICHEEYRFTTVYAEGTPDRVPLKLMLSNLTNYLSLYLKYCVAIFGLVVGCGIQIPLFWGLMTRFLTWAIDGVTTQGDFFVYLIYGESKVEGDPYHFFNLVGAVATTWSTSLAVLAVLVLAHLTLFLEHEWVSKDPGFNKLVNKKVGDENKAKSDRIERVRAAARIFQQARNNGPDRIVNENLRNLENFNRVLELNGEDQNGVIRDAVNLLIREQQDRVLQAQQVQANEEVAALLPEEDEHLDPNFNPLHEDEDSSDEESEHALDSDEEDQNQEAEEFERFVRFNDNDNDIIDHHNDDVLPNNEVPDIPNLPNVDRVEAFPPFAVPIRPIVNANPVIRQPVAPEAFGDFGAPNQPVREQDLNEVDLILSLPIPMIIIAGDVIIAIYLICVYFMPSLIGILIFQTLALFLSVISSLPFVAILSIKLHPYTSKVLDSLIYLKSYNESVDKYIDDFILTPIWTAFVNIYEQSQPLTKTERLIPLGIFYGLLFSGILLFIKRKTTIHNDSNPLKGFQRRIFVLLFDFVSSLKVFLIFFIELLVFPSYCGLLIEFVLSPLFNNQTKFILNKFTLLNQYIALRLLTNWAIGTLYMSLFAIFLGMIRHYILRKGVLFFIRSPEDPNARLVHDALVRPLSLQLSRIGLSGLVYTIFILIGFGVIVYSLKAVGSPILPIYMGSVISNFFLVYSTGYQIYSNLDLIKKYVRQFWSRAVKASANKTRLSSYILGHHDPRERGYIVYRSLFAQLRKSKPDYSEPKTLSEAKLLFKTTGAQSFFIPDGDLVRAPKSDTVSRKFVKKLFIPVTRDDIPLKTVTSGYEPDEFDDSEDELITTNNYEIVYRPPFFGLRIIAFMVMLWIFAVILISGVAVAANYIGRPLMILVNYLTERFVNEELISLSTFDDGFSYYSLRLDFASILLGLRTITKSLKRYDDRLIAKHLREEGNEDEVVEDLDPGVIRKLIDNLEGKLEFVWLGALHLLTWAYLNTWNVMIHFLAIEYPYATYFGLEPSLFLKENKSPSGSVSLNYYTLALNLIAIRFTFFRTHDLLRDDIKIIFSGGNMKAHIYDSFFDILKSFASTHLIVILLQVSYAIYDYTKHPDSYASIAKAIWQVVYEADFDERPMVYFWPLVVFVVASVSGFIKAVKLFKKLNADAKERYYSKGKTLENQVVL